jgi:hypothetical protein
MDQGFASTTSPAARRAPNSGSPSGFTASARQKLAATDQTAAEDVLCTAATRARRQFFTFEIEKRDSSRGAEIAFEVREKSYLTMSIFFTGYLDLLRPSQFFQVLAKWSCSPFRIMTQLWNA